MTTSERPVQGTPAEDPCTSIKESLLCPHCGQRMNKWATPNDPFSQWDSEFLYICFNDECPYYVKGWNTMRTQGNRAVSYRLMYDPERNRCMPIAVAGSESLRGWIVE